MSGSKKSTNKNVGKLKNGKNVMLPSKERNFKKEIDEIILEKPYYDMSTGYHL